MSDDPSAPRDAPNFGTLVDVDARTAWAHEALNFTPWLAENLERLSEAIGVGLDLTQTEHGVGRFSADIVARTAIENEVVLIENQLERSDHTHLGQIMTYLAGTEARIIVWVAPTFCEEHLSAIRWLNQHSHDEFSFFAVRLRVVQIGGSPLAPLFDVLEKPNNWDRQLQQRVASSGAPSERAQRQRAFWNRYAELYPSVLQQPAAGGGVARWKAVDGTPFVVSRYLSDKVGLFIRGGRGADGPAISPLLLPHLSSLEATLGLEMGTTQFPFDQRGPGTADPEVWDEAIHWLEAETERYVAALATLPMEVAV